MYFGGDTGQTVVYSGIVSVVTEPTGQFVMLLAHEVMVYVKVAKTVDVVISPLPLPSNVVEVFPYGTAKKVDGVLELENGAVEEEVPKTDEDEPVVDALPYGRDENVDGVIELEIRVLEEVSETEEEEPVVDDEL